MSDEAKQKKLGTVWELFLDVRTILALTLATLIAVFVMGAKANAQIDSNAKAAARDAVKTDLTVMKARIDAQDAAIKVVHDQLDDIQAEQKDSRSEQRAIREDIRLMARGRPLPPLPVLLDGGVP